LDSAIVTLTHAVSVAPESQVVLFNLARAHEKRGQLDQAIDVYVRSLAVFPGKDTSAASPLRAAYRKRHSNLAGLDERLAVARKASRARVALEPRRLEKPAPEWSLPDFTGKTLQLADFKGKVVVLDFWGSWCGPCRAELPYFQAMFDRYKDRGVAFIGINWERAPSPEEHLNAAKQFVEANRYSFPVVLDHNYQASQAYSINAFPTVYLIDKTGKIRYRNVGFDPSIDEILAAQIDSLME
jgi:peroxiredoxin